MKVETMGKGFHPEFVEAAQRVGFRIETYHRTRNLGEGPDTLRKRVDAIGLAVRVQLTSDGRIDVKAVCEPLSVHVPDSCTGLEMMARSLEQAARELRDTVIQLQMNWEPAPLPGFEPARPGVWVRQEGALRLVLRKTGPEVWDVDAYRIKGSERTLLLAGPATKLDPTSDATTAVVRVDRLYKLSPTLRASWKSIVDSLGL